MWKNSQTCKFCMKFHRPKINVTAPSANILYTHLRISREWGELELGCVHEDGTVSTIIVIQQRRERLIQAAVASKVTVAWWGG